MWEKRDELAENSVRCALFFGVVSHRMTIYMRNLKYISFGVKNRECGFQILKIEYKIRRIDLVKVEIKLLLCGQFFSEKKIIN